MVSNKNRRLTASASTSNIPQMKNAYSTAQPGDDMQRNGRHTAMENMNGATTEAGTEQTCNKQQSQSELAKIQSTVALTIDHDLLVQKTETQPRTELVTKFVDFSSKYGLGYKLSNGSYGVLFNDSTKIILHSNLFHFDYIERSKQQPVINSNGQAAESVIDQVS